MARASTAQRVGLLLGVLLVLAGSGYTRGQAPADFPHFIVPGHDPAMASLRALYWLHYPGAGPKSTMWDEWLAEPALWPAVSDSHGRSRMRAEWRAALNGRMIDPEGYVATHQHASIAHQWGWPFPFWTQGSRGYGWHFSFRNTVGPPWRPNQLSTPERWCGNGLRDLGLSDEIRRH